MPQELPGFYYDSEKNRYFSIKGAKAKAFTVPKKLAQETRPGSNCGRAGFPLLKFLSRREFCGNSIPRGARKCNNFNGEYREKIISAPTVWKYGGMNRTCNGVLEHARIEGETTGSFLLAATLNGFVSILRTDEHQNGRVTYLPEQAWPEGKCVCVGTRSPAPPPSSGGPVLWHSSAFLLPSKVTSMKSLGGNECSPTPRAFITTLGSEMCGGSVYILDLDNGSTDSSLRRVAQFRGRTVWTADCSNGSMRLPVIGTDVGAAVLDVERSQPRWVFHSKSDVLSLQHEIAVCGLRNGAIVMVDTREKARLDLHRMRCRHKEWFKVRGNVFPSQTISMPSSVSCLHLLGLRQDYFLSSSMDGSIELYDLRQTQRGCVQSYEGNVNSHSTIRFAVDPSESFLMSGGEDRRLRIWNISSGRLLFDECFSTSVISGAQWTTTNDGTSPPDTAWLSSHEALFQMHWP